MLGDPSKRTAGFGKSTGARKKVVHLTSAHSSRDTRIFQKECRSLAAAGYEVVLVAQNNRAEESVRGVLIRGLESPANRWRRMTRTTWRILHLALEEDADLYHVHDLELVPVGLFLKANGRRVIWDVHEDFPKQVLQKEWIIRPLRGTISRLVKILELTVVRVFDAVVTATPAIAVRYSGRRTIVVNNYPRLTDLEPQAADEVEASESAVVYTGSITEIRGIFEMVEAVDKVADETRIRLAMAGRISPPDLGDRLADLPEWRHVDFHGWLPQDEMFALLGRSLAGLLLFQPAPNHIQSQPNKLFEYMAAGLPIIASDFALWRELIEEEVGCGIVVDPTEPNEIAGAIRWIVNHGSDAEKMGRRGKEAVRTRFNWELEQEKLLRLYDDILGPA